MSDATPADFLSADATAAEAVARTLMGAGRSGELVEHLLHELTGDSTWAREQALDRICSLRDYAPLLEPLRDALADEDDAERRNAARSILAALASPSAGAPDDAVEWLRNLLSQTEVADVRLLAASALGESGNPASRPMLEAALADPEPNVAAAAIDALGILGDTRATPALLRLAEDGDFWTRIAAIVSLGRLGDRSAVPVIAAALREPWLASAAAAALGEIGDPSALPALRSVIEQEASGGEEAVQSAASLVINTPHGSAPEWLRARLRAREAELALRLSEEQDVDAGRLLGLAGSPAAAALLVSALEEPGQQDAAAAGLALLPPEVAISTLVEHLAAERTGNPVLILGALPPLASAGAIATVVRYLSYPDREVRAAAAEALGRSDEDLVLEALAEALAEPGSHHGVALAFGRLGSARCDPLAELLKQGTPAVRAAAAEGLAHCGADHVEHLRQAIQEETDEEARHALIRALGASGTAAAVEELISLLNAPDTEVRFAAVQALGRSRHPDAFAPLSTALGDAHPEIRAAALAALGEIGDPRASGPLSSHLADEDRDLRRTAIFALDRMATPEVGDRLVGALSDPDLEVRLTAIRVLKRLGMSDAADAIEEVADRDAEPLVRREAAQALVGLRSPQTGEHR